MVWGAPCSRAPHSPFLQFRNTNPKTALGASIEPEPLESQKASPYVHCFHTVALSHRSWGASPSGIPFSLDASAYGLGAIRRRPDSLRKCFCQHVRYGTSEYTHCRDSARFDDGRHRAGPGRREIPPRRRCTHPAVSRPCSGRPFLSRTPLPGRTHARACGRSASRSAGRTPSSSLCTDVPRRHLQSWSPCAALCSEPLRSPF